MSTTASGTSRRSDRSAIQWPSLVPSHAAPGVSHGGLAHIAMRGRAGACNAISGVPDTFLIARKPPVASSVAAGLIATTVAMTARLDRGGAGS